MQYLAAAEDGVQDTEPVGIDLPLHRKPGERSGNPRFGPSGRSSAAVPRRSR